MSSNSGLLGDTGLTREGFNKVGGGLISIDDNDDLDVNSQGFARMWKVYSGQLHGSDPPGDLVERTVAWSCAATCTVSVIFWAWAAQNMSSLGNLDLGIFCFAGSFATNLYGWLSSREPDELYALKLANRFRLAPVAHILVAATYAFGAWMVPSAAFRTYCALFGCLWAASAFMVRGLADRWYWVVNDRGQETQAGAGSDSLSSGAPLTGSGNPFEDVGSGGSSTSGGRAGVVGDGDGGGANGAVGYTGLDDEDDAFITEL